MKIVSNKYIKNIIPLNILQKTIIEDQGLQFEVNVLNNLNKKPNGIKSKNDKNPFLPPFEEDLFIQSFI